MRREHRPAEPGRHDAAPQLRPGEPGPAADVLALQRAAGNRAVGALLAREPEAAPAKERPAATMTFGLGDEIVMPLEASHWNLPEKEVEVGFEADNPAAPIVFEASMQVKQYATGFVSTHDLTFRMTGVEVRRNQIGGSDESGASVVYVTLGFETVKQEQV